MKRIICLLLLTACAQVNPSATTQPELPDTCGAAERRNLVGQDATALERVLILRMVRVIRPGDVVTQDFRPERINFEVTTDNKIRAVTCG